VKTKSNNYPIYGVEPPESNEWGIAIGISKASAWVVERNQFDTSGTAWNKIQLVIYWQKRECQCGI
jgi:hypothetical protein